MYNSLLYKYYQTLHKEILPSTNTVLLGELVFCLPQNPDEQTSVPIDFQKLSFFGWQRAVV